MSESCPRARRDGADQDGTMKRVLCLGALLTILAVACRPPGSGGGDDAGDDPGPAVQMNEVQVLSTHNSYKIEPEPALLDALRLVLGDELADGFEYAGEKFKSLSAVAKAVTGSHMNGFRFFNLGGES
jgi:hypothetical protein